MIQLKVYEECNPKLKENFLNSVTGIPAIGSIYEPLYQSSSLDKYRFNKSIKKLVDNLCDMYHQLHATDIDVDLNLSPIKIYINQDVPACLINNELVINALRHAFTPYKNALITIGLSESENEVLTLSISDNRAGIPDEFTTLSRNDTLGFHLVDTLLIKIETEHQVHSSKQGTNFTFSFKKTSKKENMQCFYKQTYLLAF